LRAVRYARPNGPYVLGGHCNGALVAVEMASQLVAEGEEVPLVVVLDAKAPAPWRRDIADASAAASTLPSQRDTERSPAEKTGSVRDVFLRYRRAIAGYAPEHYPGRIAVLCSEHTHDARQDLGWSAISRQVETHAIPGDHHTSITRHVATTGALIKACLEAVNDSSTR
jgi:thioesterase domain-containing protein